MILPFPCLISSTFIHAYIHQTWITCCHLLCLLSYLITLADCFLLSPIKDVALASVSMRPIPFAPVLEKLAFSDMNYGSVRRFYIETPEDNAIPITLQESMINANPPERVFRLKGADHSPFFSKPQALHKILLEISKIPSTWKADSSSSHSGFWRVFPPTRAPTDIDRNTTTISNSCSCPCDNEGALADM